MRKRCLCKLAILVALGALSAAGDLRAGGLDVPSYSVGDKLVWRSEGRRSDWTETVIAVEEDLVSWKASNGDIVKTPTNFVLPPVAYQQVQHGTGGFEIVEMTGDLFPLKPGNWISVRLRKRDDAEEWTRFCQVGDWSEIDVTAGHFEVILVRCHEINRTKVWYYAPEIGTYVLYVNTHHIDGSESQELIAIDRANS